MINGVYSEVRCHELVHRSKLGNHLLFELQLLHESLNRVDLEHSLVIKVVERLAIISHILDVIFDQVAVRQPLQVRGTVEVVC